MTRDGRLAEPWLTLARVAWGIIVATTIALSAVGFVEGFRSPELLRQEAILAALGSMGIPLELAMAIGLVVPMAACLFAGALIFWRRSGELVGIFFSLALVTLGASMTRSLIMVQEAHPVLHPPARAILLLGMNTCASCGWAHGTPSTDATNSDGSSGAMTQSPTLRTKGADTSGLRDVALVVARRVVLEGGHTAEDGDAGDDDSADDALIPSSMDLLLP